MVGESPAVDEQYCVWLAGEPPGVVAAIARAVATDLAGEGHVEVLGLSGPARLDEVGGVCRLGTVAVVVGLEALDEASRAEMGLGRVVEVWVGDVPPPGAVPAVVVPPEPARAGESAQVVLRHLAAAGLSHPLDEYSDEDEAAVADRLQKFGYL